MDTQEISPSALARIFHRVSSRDDGDDWYDDASSKASRRQRVETRRGRKSRKVSSERPDPAAQQKAGELSALGRFITI